MEFRWPYYHNGKNVVVPGHTDFRTRLILYGDYNKQKISTLENVRLYDSRGGGGTLELLATIFMRPWYRTSTIFRTDPWDLHGYRHRRRTSNTVRRRRRRRLGHDVVIFHALLVPYPTIFLTEPLALRRSHSPDRRDGPSRPRPRRIPNGGDGGGGSVTP